MPQNGGSLDFERPKVRRMGRVMRVTIEDENTIDESSTAAKSKYKSRIKGI